MRLGQRSAFVFTEALALPVSNGMDEIKSPHEENDIEKIKQERDDYLAGWQRAKADFINYKKDEVRRLEEIARYGSEELILEAIAVLDNFDLALRAIEAEKRSAPTPEESRSPDQKRGIDKGIYMIRGQIEDILKRHGAERIKIQPGDRFDPRTSEAIVLIESDMPEGTVVEEIEAGYKMYDKILRPARVKVSKEK